MRTYCSAWSINSKPEILKLEFSPLARMCNAGDLHMYGKAGVQFYTQPKTVTSKWPVEDVAYAEDSTHSSSTATTTAGGSQRLPGLDRVGAQ